MRLANLDRKQLILDYLKTPEGRKSLSDSICLPHEDGKITFIESTGIFAVFDEHSRPFVLPR